jgi:DNA-binding response OmpR family regulator
MHYELLTTAAWARTGLAPVVASTTKMRNDPAPAIIEAMKRRPRILVVEDDPTVADVVARYLERDGFDVEAAGDGLKAIDRVTAEPPDLMILDLMLPGLDGLEVFRRVRSFAPVPVIMLTARGDEHDRVMGLELGADDYLGKPFSPRELTARVKSVLRRAEGATGLPTESRQTLSASGLDVDVASREVWVDRRSVSLTAREFDLLVFFMRHPHQVFRREELLEHVWGFTFGDTSTVTVHVRRLREKIEHDPSSPARIQTVWGVGYRFEP